jgi:predicted amidohydrolase YtcJ
MAWRQMYLNAALAGFQFQTHAVGDATTDRVINAYAYVAAQVPLDAVRWSVLHLMLPSDDDFVEDEAARFVHIRAGRPGAAGCSDGRVLGHRPRPAGLPAGSHPGRRHGVGGGCDAPAASTSPMTSMQWMMTRLCLDAADQAISIREALRLYTLGSAQTQPWEHEIGSLEPAKLADFAVLDTNPLAVESSQL